MELMDEMMEGMEVNGMRKMVWVMEVMEVVLTMAVDSVEGIGHPSPSQGTLLVQYRSHQGQDFLKQYGW